MPAKDMQWVIEGKTIPWYQADVHWYIVGGQHMYQACVSIAKKEVSGSDKHKFYTEFDVIPVYSRDPDMLIKVSNALNPDEGQGRHRELPVPAKERPGQVD